MKSCESFSPSHRNYLILHWKTVHAHGSCEIDITALHVTNVVAREAFGDCRFTRVGLVELWFVFRRLHGIVLLLLNDDTAGDDNETEENADCN